MTDIYSQSLNTVLKSHKSKTGIHSRFLDLELLCNVALKQAIESSSFMSLDDVFVERYMSVAVARHRTGHCYSSIRGGAGERGEIISQFSP